METVILAFEGEKSMSRIREIIENAGLASCLTCHTGAEVKRLVRQQQVNTVICGYKLRDETAEALFEALPASCNMLVIAIQSLVGMINDPGILRLTAPIARSELLASVQMLMEMGQRMERFVVRPGRTVREQSIIDQAKRILVERNGITEEQAHSFLQKQSMDSGAKLVQTAQLILDGASL